MNGDVHQYDRPDYPQNAEANFSLLALNTPLLETTRNLTSWQKIPIQCFVINVK